MLLSRRSSLLITPWMLGKWVSMTGTASCPPSSVIPFFPVSVLGTEDSSGIAHTGVVLSARASVAPRAFIEAMLRQSAQYLIFTYLSKAPPFCGHRPSTTHALKSAIYLATCCVGGFFFTGTRKTEWNYVGLRNT
ncbi:uncharacterized protein EI90DRAFT_1746525 [Cantharellus anzutake]|uniref:uncharacterized protein n=1 Tax=Cantharellus anzutake TaxID=1750568 RepID=UPI0019077E41|nr:uncharacterized protein EI90DRAFT_1746525 [Cantharellus anzutake]KAF8341514.1 hypothetical protein EI90DRAFT_1746525 [Cantharellus anzutake]